MSAFLRHSVLAFCWYSWKVVLVAVGTGYWVLAGSRRWLLLLVLVRGGKRFNAVKSEALFSGSGSTINLTLS